MTRRMAFGILGFGRFAEKWLVSAFSNSRRAKLVAVQVRTRSVRIPEIQTYSDIDDLLADPRVEAVYVCSANSYHEEHVRRSLKAGKHVLCEKPMALTSAECRRMIKTARQYQRYLAVGHMLRFSPALQFLKRVVDHGSLGHIRFARADFSYRLDSKRRRWSRIKAIAGGGALLDAGIHGLDSLRYVLAAKTLKVLTCRLTPSTQQSVENGAAATLELPGGGFALLSVNSNAAYGSSLELVGDKGRLRLDGFIRCRGEAILTIEHEIGMRTISKQSIFKIQRVYENQIDAFCVAASAKKRPLLSAENGQANLEIIQALYQRSSDKL